MHGNQGRLPSSTLPFPDVKRAVVFIQNYTSDFGIPYPAALNGCDDMPPIFCQVPVVTSLPAEIVMTCTATNYQAAGRDLFLHHLASVFATHQVYEATS